MPTYQRQKRYYVGERLIKLRADAGVTQLDLATKTGKRPETIWRWERGGGIKESDCEKLAKALGVTKNELIGAELPPGATPLPTDYVKIPLLGTCPASAKEFVNDEVLGWEAVPAEAVRGKRAYLLKVKGDSMNRAGIDSGDTVIVNADRQPENGNIVVALVDGECMIKRYYKQEKQVKLAPDSTNMKHQPHIFTKKNDVMMRGVVERVWMKKLK